MRFMWYFRGWGGLLSTFCPRGQGGGGKCPRLSTRGGEGVKIGQNLVHVVVECPQSERSEQFLKLVSGIFATLLAILANLWHFSQLFSQLLCMSFWIWLKKNIILLQEIISIICWHSMEYGAPVVILNLVNIAYSGIFDPFSHTGYYIYGAFTNFLAIFVYLML